jgi:hypothetical protein
MVGGNSSFTCGGGQRSGGQGESGAAGVVDDGADFPGNGVDGDEIGLVGKIPAEEEEVLTVDAARGGADFVGLRFKAPRARDGSSSGLSPS